MKKNVLALVLGSAMTVSMGMSAFAESTTEAATEAAPGVMKAAEGATIEEIPTDFTTIQEGKLLVATSPDFAPYEFYSIDDNGDPQLAGFDISLAQRIADDLGLELQVVPMDFDGILMELQNGNVDLGISGFSPEPERAEIFDFSDLYYYGGQSFVIRAADKDKYTSYDDFKGLPVGAQTGSIQYTLAEENTPDANITGLAKVTDIITELESGKLEGAFIETAVARSYIQNYPDLMIAWDVPYDSMGSAVALQKGSNLLPAVNAVINNCLVDGSMDKYVAEANELASGKVYEGQLDENGEMMTEASTE